jgi:hypothetical protein
VKWTSAVSGKGKVRKVRGEEEEKVVREVEQHLALLPHGPHKVQGAEKRQEREKEKGKAKRREDRTFRRLGRATQLPL